MRRSFLECSIPCYFEPTFLFTGILHLWSDVRPPEVSGRQKSRCGHPPSFARSQNCRKRHFGILQKMLQKILQKNSYVSSYKRTFVEYTRDSDTKDGSCLRLLSSFFYAVNRNKPDHSRKKKQPFVVGKYAYTFRLPHKNKTGHHVTERSQEVRVWELWFNENRKAYPGQENLW